ncbi:MAG: ComEA family DNA-binding protein [Gemmatimonadota bacterium]
MTPEERRTVVVTAAVLLLASLVRVGWEARSRLPLLPADTSAYAGLLEETDRLIADEDRRNTPLAEGERIDPNRASEVELSRLPGVGPALAGRIVASREGVGPFQRPEDLARVPGIGEATVARLRNLVDLADPPPPGAEGLGEGAVAGGGIGGGRLDLNRAGAAELEELPGIGPALSARILEARRARGGFRHVDELLDVQGIGPAVLERLRPHLEVW